MRRLNALADRGRPLQREVVVQQSAVRGHRFANDRTAVLAAALPVVPVAVDLRHEPLAVGQEHQGVVGLREYLQQAVDRFRQQRLGVERPAQGLRNSQHHAQLIPRAGLGNRVGVERRIQAVGNARRIGEPVIGDGQIAAEFQQPAADLDPVSMGQGHSLVLRHRAAVQRRRVPANIHQPIAIALEVHAQVFAADRPVVQRHEALLPVAPDQNLRLAEVVAAASFGTQQYLQRCRHDALLHGIAPALSGQSDDKASAWSLRILKTLSSADTLNIFMTPTIDWCSYVPQPATSMIPDYRGVSIRGS